ncbi:MAG: hypothetical protein PGN37_21765 [Mycobacterium kyogaense]|uniref:hypothetical protein n=1 Tax=Mycobacterium kyogaense TaxID=2212479 RepID=UPI002FF95140
MTRQRWLAALLACAAVLLTGQVLVGTPAAHADPLDPIRAAVNNARQGSPCGPLKYNIALEGEAQAAVGNRAPGVPPAGQYNGKVTLVTAYGDPQAAAIGALMGKEVNAALRDCSNTEFGVGFIRDEDKEDDAVAVAIGAPPAAPAAPAAPAPAPPVQCPPGSTSPTVPAGQQCTAAPKPDVACPDGKTVPAGAECPAPTNAVRVSFSKGLGIWKVNVANSADISGQCTYNAISDNGTPGASRNFAIAAKGTADFTVPAPLLLTSYHVVTSCTGTYAGKTVEFGHDEQDVSLGS